MSLPDRLKDACRSAGHEDLPAGVLPAFERHGHGPVKVMVLSGWLNTAGDWAAWAAGLDAERFTVACVDYRGYGGSLRLPGRYDFDEVADDCLRLADALAWERFSLAGHSMGGLAMQKILCAAPARIDSLLAICGVPARGSRLNADRRVRFDAAVSDPAARADILHGSTGGRLPAAWSHRFALASLQRSLPHACRSYLAAWAGDGFDWPASERPTLPVRLIVGADDPSLNAAAMERTWRQDHPDADILVLDACGHYPMLEAPLRLAAACQAFWTSLPPSAGRAAS